MKKNKMQMLSCLLAITMLSGCSAHQTQPEATSINQAMLIEKSAQEQERYSFPETFTGDWTAQEGKLTIHADAQVVAEQGVVLPTATVTPREFTQEDVDSLLRVFLKGEPLYSFVQTKQELQDWLDYINSPEWKSDPDKPNSPEQLEQRRKELNDWYNAEIAQAPDEKPIVHGFADSGKPNEVSGFATVDGVKYEINIQNEVGEFWTKAQIIRHDFKYWDKQDWGGVSKEDAIRQGNALMQELGFDAYVLDDAQQQPNSGEWQLVYVPTVNGIRLSSVREDRFESHEGNAYNSFQYSTYHCSEETNPDSVSWPMDIIFISVGGDGILSFTWDSPSTEPVVKESQSALLPFDEIASIANTMLPIVVIGPSEARSLVDIDRINGFDTHMDVEITKVSLTLMRIRDKGSLQGTIVPVWDFWGTWDWYEPGEDASDTMRKGANYTTQPMLTLNAIDGSVVSRLFGY
ncbi:MAG: DUF6034 family protein [Clostridiales bacterium]|nr:DUF6034 family protein [Clostridiales bacterium]